jgi:hypothetical protein
LLLHCTLFNCFVLCREFRWQVTQNSFMELGNRNFLTYSSTVTPCNQKVTKSNLKKSDILIINRCIIINDLLIFQLNSSFQKPYIFWDVTPCCSRKTRFFGGMNHLYHQHEKNRLARHMVSSNRNVGSYKSHTAYHSRRRHTS